MNLNDLLATYVPPKYLIEKLFKEGYLYTITGLTGSGKTAIALYIAWCEAQGLPIGDRNTHSGGRRVVYFAGENADDVTQRLCDMVDTYDGAMPSNFLVMPTAGREAADRAIHRGGSAFRQRGRRQPWCDEKGRLHGGVTAREISGC